MQKVTLVQPSLAVLPHNVTLMANINLYSAMSPVASVGVSTAKDWKSQVPEEVVKDSVLQQVS